MPLFSRQPAVPVAPPAPIEPASIPGAPDPQPGGGRSLVDHRRFLAAQVKPLPPFAVTLLDAAGLTLCETIRSDLNLPLAATATTDGWAVRRANLAGAGPTHPITLPVAGLVQATDLVPEPLEPGTAVRLGVGVPLPPGADAVVSLEAANLSVHQGEQQVTFVAEPAAGSNLNPAGSRIAAGSVLAEDGTPLRPAVLALLAEIGLDKVLVRPRPRVVVLSVGELLVEPGHPLPTLHHRYNSTPVLLTAAATAAGAQVFCPPAVATPGAVPEVVNSQLVRADLMVLLREPGQDLHQILGGLGAFDAATVAELPGEQILALVGPERIPLLALPAEPASAWLGWALLGRVLLDGLAGHRIDTSQPVTLPVITAIPAAPGPRALLGRRTARGVAPLDVAASGVEAAQADLVILLDAGVAVSAHQDVDCLVMG